MKPFKEKIWLSSPTMHGEELKYMEEAYHSNWMSTVGENINEIEKQICTYLDCGYAVALSAGTAALHLAVKLAGIKRGDKVLCSDITFGATVNPILYEGGIPVFIDSERSSWNMDPQALEKAFSIYPEAKAAMVVNLYGVPAKLDELRRICDKHHAVLIEDAAESLGANYKGKPTGTYGKYGVLSFNGNKIITGSSGGMLVTDEETAAFRARKWSTQSRENAPWYQHEEIGYNYRMSNVIAGVIRGQYPYLKEHIVRKKEIYMRYKEGLKDLPVQMNPYSEEDSEPNFWLSCILIDKEAMCRQVRSDCEALYQTEPGKSCPTEILETLARYGAEGRPIWKPMHMQPIFRNYPFITVNGSGRVYSEGKNWMDVGADIFQRGLCLPSDIKMSLQDQEAVIEIIKSCFKK